MQLQIVLCLGVIEGFFCLEGGKCVLGVKYVVLLSISIGSRMVKGKQSKRVRTTQLVVVWCQLNTH